MNKFIVRFIFLLINLLAILSSCLMHYYKSQKLSEDNFKKSMRVIYFFYKYYIFTNNPVSFKFVDFIVLF